MVNYNFLSVFELENVLDSGMNQGFGKFKKLTIQIIGEWLRMRQKEFYEIQKTKELAEKNKRELNINCSPLGSVLVTKFSLLKNGLISEIIYEKYSLKFLFEIQQKGENVRDFLLNAETEFKRENE